MNQLRALHRAGVTSNNQANQLDRLIKAVEQAKSRPIWTPNTTRQQQAELIEQLRRELNKYKEDLSSDEEIFAEKTKEIESLKGHIRELEEEKVALSNQLQETLIRVKKHEDQLFQQQLQLNHFHLSQGREGTAVLPSPRGTRIQTAPMVPGSVPENNREVHSSPPVFLVDRIIQDFRARSQLLVSQHEEEDEVVCTLSDTSESEDEADEEPERQLGRTWNVKKDGPKTTQVPSLQRQNKASKNSKVKVLSKDVTETKDKGLKPDILDRSEVEALRSSTQVIGKEVQQTELRLHSAQQKLRDLNMNIR